MLTYIILTALANVIISYYMLNCEKSESTTGYVEKFGALEFYIVSAVIGCVMIPIIIICTIFSILTRK